MNPSHMIYSNQVGAIRSDDPDAVPRLQAKIVAAEKLQATMKTANSIIRNPRLTDDEKVVQLLNECLIPPMDGYQLLKPDFAGRIGYPAYKLTNNSANIHRMQERLVALTREAKRGYCIVEFAGGLVEDNAQDNRIRVFYKAKPSAETIAKLKANGFHWAPTVGAWQRLRNDQARLAAAWVTGIDWSKATADEPLSPELKGLLREAFRRLDQRIAAKTKAEQSADVTATGAQASVRTAPVVRSSPAIRL